MGILQTHTGTINTFTINYAIYETTIESEIIFLAAVVNLLQNPRSSHCTVNVIYVDPILPHITLIVEFVFQMLCMDIVVCNYVWKISCS